jgi:hypothetical protein
MIKMAMREQHGIKNAIRSSGRAIQGLGFFAALKETAINQNPSVLRLDAIT